MTVEKMSKLLSPAPKTINIHVFERNALALVNGQR